MSDTITPELSRIIEATARVAAERAVELERAKHPRPPHVNLSQASLMLKRDPKTVKRILARQGVMLNPFGLIPIEEIDRLRASIPHNLPQAA